MAQQDNKEAIPTASGGGLRWWQVVVLGLAGALLVGAAVYILGAPRYQASASLLVGGDRSSGVLAEAAERFGGVGLLGYAPGADARLVTILSSHRMRSEVALESELARRLALEKPAAAPSVLARMTKIDMMPGAAIRITVTTTGPSRFQQWIGRTEGPDDDEARELAAELANRYIQSLREYMGEISRTDLEFVIDRRAEVEKELLELEDRLQRFRLENITLDPPQDARILTDELKSASQTYAGAMAEREGLKQSLATARRHLDSEQAMRVQTEVTARNPVISDLSQQLADLRVQLTAERDGGKKPSHPDIMALEEKINATETELEGVREDILMQVSRGANPAYDALATRVTQLEIDYAQAEARTMAAQRHMSRLENRTEQMPAVLREYLMLNRDREIKQELLISLSRRLELTRIEDKREAEDKLQVLDEAIPPLQKSGPSTVRSAAVTFILLVLVLGLWSLRQSGYFRPYEEN